MGALVVLIIFLAIGVITFNWLNDMHSFTDSTFLTVQTVTTVRIIS